MLLGQASGQFLPDDGHMRSTLPQVMERQDQALRMALAGMSNDQIAQALQYQSVAGAWKAIRSAIARHTGAKSIAEVQAAMKSKEEGLRTQWRTQVLQEMLRLTPGGKPERADGETHARHSQ